MDAIDRLRRFNRDYTARMGLLARNYLDTGMNVTEVRVLHELAEEPGVTARMLARRLGIDEGYLSRLLKRFEAAGSLARSRTGQDGRQWHLRLTSDGEQMYAPLAARSRADVSERLGHASADAVAGAADTLLDFLSLDPNDVVLRDLQPGDAGWLIEQHGRLYDRDEGFDHTFEALVAEILADFLCNRDPAVDRGWIAAQGSLRLGSIFCVRLDETTAKLRLFLLLPEARGLGLGRRMLETCMRYARQTGFQRMKLWTHESHRAACALYQKSGWRLLSSEPKRSFGQPVVEQHWDITL